MGIVWLASYPKSGNTWLRFLLHAVLFGPIESTAQVAQRFPDIHVTPTLPETGARVIAKTHLKWTDQHPGADRTERAVLIVRHVRDAFLSALNFRRLHDEKETITRLTPEQYALEFIQAAGDRVWDSLGYGTWPGHARSWLDQPRFPVHLVRFEDLRRDTAGHLHPLLTFLSIPADDAAIERAVDLAGFDRMRALEQREKSATPDRNPVFAGDQRQMRKGYMFMNAGAVGQSLSHIRPDLDALFDKRFAHTLKRLGY
ncbi:MAG: sulfotransferase domain-containing protein [Phycisphaerae bacterium]|nr:sulfotransferase domain-containing protein [Phycisphaerae bacterium]